MGAIAAAGGIAIAGSLAAGLGVVAAWQVGRVLWRFAEHGSTSATVARVRGPNGSVYRIRRRDIMKTRLLIGRDGELAMKVAYDAGRKYDVFVSLEGQHARSAAATLLPVVNRRGGSKDEVQHAVGRIERAGSAERFLKDQARRGETLTRVVLPEEARSFANAEDAAWQSGLYALSTPASLALEMALHEEQERRALEGELAELEQAWRDAEEVGAIADSLLLPPMVETSLARLRGKPRPGK